MGNTERLICNSVKWFNFKNCAFLIHIRMLKGFFLSFQQLKLLKLYKQRFFFLLFWLVLLQRDRYSSNLMSYCGTLKPFSQALCVTSMLLNPCAWIVSLTSAKAGLHSLILKISHVHINSCCCHFYLRFCMVKHMAWIWDWLNIKIL